LDFHVFRKLSAGIYALSDRLGFSGAVRDSGWRSRRLMLLCWHGISLADEHTWNPWLYVSPDRFRQRLRILAEDGYKVLPLDEALKRLWSGDLPPRSVVITFDDGFYDFFRYAAPILEEFGFPATLYLTTSYVDHRVPVFNLIVSYLLWKAQGPSRRLPDGSPLTSPKEVDAAAAGIVEQAEREGATIPQRNEIARALANELGLDYGAFERQRLLAMMEPSEIRGILGSGRIAIECHTHNHRTPAEPELMQRELRENRDRIEQITGRRAVHLAYPSGVFRQEHFPVLEQEGFESAATCEVRIASAGDHRYLVPRLLDHDDLTAEQYRSWLTGAHSLGRTT
jgi:peptidoglycan/xylan/chitin deacetylase (PgdA/CDA1 family)